LNPRTKVTIIYFFKIMEHYTNPDLLKVKTMFDEINIKLN